MTNKEMVAAIINDNLFNELTPATIHEQVQKKFNKSITAKAISSLMSKSFRNCFERRGAGYYFITKLPEVQNDSI